MNALTRAWETAREQLAASESGQRLWAWYESASPREQGLARWVGITVAVLLIVLLLVMPAHDFSQQSQQAYRSQAETLAWMEANRHLVAGAEGRREGESLLTVATQTAAALNLTIRRYEPAGDSGLNLWLENVPFDQTMLWLEMLERERGVATAELSARRRSEAGRVDVRVVLEG